MISYPDDTIQRIANYLASRPYAEVFKLMQEIQTRGIKIDVSTSDKERQSEAYLEAMG